jgi:predicted DNA-binding protein YlxM (UPF0122 family)
MKNLINYHDYGFIPETKDQENSFEQQDLHYGRIAERAMRRSPLGISEIARRLDVSRRTLYNWFETKDLNLNIISKIGYIISHDFSKDLPEDLNRKMKLLSNEYIDNQPPSPIIKSNEPIYFWMNRYIELLEKFNEKLNYRLNNSN